MGESLINLSLPSNVNLLGQHTYTDRTTPRQGIKSLVFIGLIRINQSQNLCCMITVFTAAKYEIKIECLAGTLINAFSKQGQSSQCYMQNISGKQIKQNNTPKNPHSMTKQHQLTWTPGKKLQSRWLGKGQVWWQCVPEQLGNAPSSPCQTRSWWCWHPLAWSSGHQFLSPGCSLHGGPRGGHGFYLAALMAAPIHPRWDGREQTETLILQRGVTCD